MKIPREIKRYCPFCRKHQIHVVKQVKTAGRRKSALKFGERRRRPNIDRGYGGSPYPKTEHGVKYGAKVTKKVMVKYTCKVCNKSHQNAKPVRLKKFEILQQ